MEKRINLRWKRRWGSWTAKVHSAHQAAGWLPGEFRWIPACDGNVLLSEDQGTMIRKTDEPVTCQRCQRALGLPVTKDTSVPKRPSSSGTFYFSEDGMTMYREPSHSQSYNRDTGKWDVIAVKAPKPFYAEMQIEKLSWGRSTKWFSVRDIATGVTYTISTTEMFKIMKSVGIQPGGIIPRGRWVYVKKGTAGGIGLDISGCESSEDVNE